MTDSQEFSNYSTNFKTGQAPISPLIIISAHSGRYYPDEFLEKACLTKQQFRFFEDMYMDHLIFDQTHDLGFTNLIAHYPRSFIDLNRHIDEIDTALFSDTPKNRTFITSSKVAAGYGVIPSRFFNSQIYDQPHPVSYFMDRLQRYYLPFHQKLQTIIDQTYQKFGKCLILDCHSMPSLIPTKSTSLHTPVTHLRKTGFADFVLGTRHGTSCDPEITNLITQFLTHHAYRVSQDIPYAGGYITQTYAYAAKAISVIQIETNRNLYMDEISFHKKSEFSELNSVFRSLFKIIIDKIHVAQ